MSVLTEPRVEFDQATDKLLDDLDGETGEGWWCVRTLPFPCPAAGCDFVALFLTAAHRIVLWPRQDDRSLLRFSADAKQLGRDPHVTLYKPGMGAAVPYDRWQQIARPVHGKAERPADRPWRSF